MTQLPPWSYSALECFEQCPRKFYHRYILKEKGSETEAQRKGNEFDKAVENRLQHGTPLPAEWAQHDGYAESLYRMKKDCQLYTQLKMGIDRDFKYCGFFADNVWGRGVIDVALVSRRTDGATGCTAIITDWKTGKNSEKTQYSNNGLQLKIFAAMLFKLFPGVTRITAFNLWLKTSEIGKPYAFTRADEAQLWQEILPRIMAMEKAAAAMLWPEKQGPLCGYCPVKQCQHNRS